MRDPDRAHEHELFDMTDVKNKARFRAASHPTPGGLPQPTLAQAMLMAVAIAYGLHALFMSGPAMRAAAREQLERIVADEDRDVCSQFGIRPGTSQFDVCSRELASVRKKQVERDNAAAQGIP